MTCEGRLASRDAAGGAAEEYLRAFGARRVLSHSAYREAMLPLNTRKLMREAGLMSASEDERARGRGCAAGCSTCESAQLCGASSSGASGAAAGSQGDAWEGEVPFALPTFIEDCTLLLVNGGSGPDVYLATLMVGPRGRVLVADPDERRLERARAYVAESVPPGQRSLAPVEYVVATGESLPLADESVDSVAFNPYFNVALDKQALLAEALRVLVAGGELYVATLFASRRLSRQVASNEALCGNLVGGALYVEDFRRMLARLGIYCFRYMDQHEIDVSALFGRVGPAVADELRETQFSYRVVRTFKIFDFEDLCENYGQVLTYKGNAPGCEQYIDINDTHRFFTWNPLRVCGNTAAFVEQTRLAKYFDIEGDRRKHLGTYDYCLYCGTCIGESGRLSDMARHLAELDMSRKNPAESQACAALPRGCGVM